MEIPKNLKDEIWDYCRLNNISNIDEFTLKLLKQGFTVEKFGSTPTPRETIIEKIVEKIVEVPVDRIVEKIVEIPIETLNTEMTQSMKICLEVHEKCKEELLKQVDISHILRKELEEEKKKNKNDLYGER